MAYIFEKENFKGYLRSRATRSWFSKNASNVRYHSYGSSGVQNEDIFKDDYTVKVNEVLRDPRLDRGGERAGSVAGMVAGTTGIGLAACLAPFTFGGSLLAAGAAGAGVLGSAAALDHSSRPGKIYFTLAADNSEWVANTSDYTFGVAGISSDICRWSNRVYEEKFETHSYQSQPPK